MNRKAIRPRNSRERQLKNKEDWNTATAIEQYWHDTNCICDLCNSEITGRHMIDGLVYGTMYEFACMCATCHHAKGSGFGEGKGQLYTRLNDGQFILTYGFTSYQLEEIGDDNDDDDLW
ncbi:MAG: hypothetical protein KJS45_09795 [Bacteroidetes bacterium]|nr:hypothetical protein [Bacteroidota bacterium]GDX48172.1 hypothetical protein LBMAG25_09900 [Bacteroidota bacterium]